MRGSRQCTPPPLSLSLCLVFLSVSVSVCLSLSVSLCLSLSVSLPHTAACLGRTPICEKCETETETENCCIITGTCKSKITDFEYLGFERENAKRKFGVAYPFYPRSP